jgi:hypothetical protein
MGRTVAMPMTESGVHQIVREAFDTYERDIAKPRFEKTDAQLGEVLSMSGQIKGGVTTIKWTLKYLGSAIVVGAALVKIVQAALGHGW